jgi:hypothetical protein
MSKYRFTKTWFHPTGIFTELQNLFPPQGKIDILEIGSFEGLSTVWFIENMMLNRQSTLTCVDPWVSFSQDEDSLLSYGNENIEWNKEWGDVLGAKDLFEYNIKQTGSEDCVIVRQGLSCDVLPRLHCDKMLYDIIFVDGNHTSVFVLTDAVMGWYLLKEGGIIIFDDYNWSIDDSELHKPKIAIDIFITIFSEYCEVIFDKRDKKRKIIKRTK